MANQYLAEIVEFTANIDKAVIAGMPEFLIKDLETADQTIELKNPMQLKIWIKFAGSTYIPDSVNALLLNIESGEAMDLSIRIIKQKTFYFIAELDEWLNAGKYKIQINGSSGQVQIKFTIN